MWVIHVELRGVTFSAGDGEVNGNPSTQSSQVAALYRQFKRELSIDEAMAKVRALSRRDQDKLFCLALQDFSHHGGELPGKLADGIARLQGYQSGDSKILWSRVKRRRSIGDVVAKSRYLIDAEVEDVVERCWQRSALASGGDWFMKVAIALQKTREST